MTQVEKKVQDCDKTFEYWFEFDVKVKFVGRGIRIPEHEEDYLKSAIASHIEKGAYSYTDANSLTTLADYKRYYNDRQFNISHTCYEVDGVDRDELMKERDFRKDHDEHYTDVEQVEVTATSWNDDVMEEYETY